MIVLAAAIIALTVVGSFFDYQIAQAVYLGQGARENFFGVLFAFIGVIPTFVGWSFLGASILTLMKKKELSKGKRRALITLSVLLFLLSFFYYCNTLLMVNGNAFPMHWAVAYPIGIAAIGAAAYLGYRLSRKNENDELLKRVVFLAIVSLVIMLIIMLTKGIMDRPRYRFVMDNEHFFVNWWQKGSEIKELAAAGAAGDEFSSFPSGHSAYSMFAVFIFPALARYDKRLEKYEGVLFFVGVLWWALTAFSRMTVGAHYLTDVTIAGGVTLFIYAVSVWIKRCITKK